MSAFSAAAQDEDGDIIKTLQARVADLEAQLYAVGAGGVGSTVARQDHPEQHLDMVPEGWKLVPVEPADSQIRAAQDTWWYACNCETYWDQIYAAMIAAAPQPPVVEQPQSVTDCHQSQPQGEPPGSTESAYQRGYLDGMSKGRRDAESDAAEQQTKREPLTDDAATRLVQSVVAGSDRPIGMVAFGLLVARAIERAHRIGVEA